MINSCGLPPRGGRSAGEWLRSVALVVGRARDPEAASQVGRCLFLPSDGCRGGGEAAAGQDPAQHVGGGGFTDVGLEDAVGVAVAADRKVEVVRGPAAADHGVELFAGHQVVDEAVGGVGGDSLGGVDGGGVAELDRLPHIVPGQGDRLAGAAVEGADAAVGGEGGDGPPVAVADPVPAGGEAAVVAAGDDQVIDTGAVPVRQVDLQQW